MIEGLLLFFYLLILVSIVLVINQQKYANTPLSTIFILGFFAKLIGGLAFAAVYKFYYGGGDTLNYFRDCQILNEAFLKDPIAALKIVFLPKGSFSHDVFNYTSRMWFDRDPASFWVIRLIGPLTVLAFNSFWITTLLVSTFSFFMVWSFYIALIKIYPRIYKNLALAILFMPSIFFWGSGIMKDTLTFSFLALILKVLLDAHRGKYSLSSMLIASVCFYFTISIKAYVAACLIPAIIIYLVIRFKKLIPNPTVQSIVTPIFLLTTAAASIVVLNYFSEYLGKYSLDNFEETVEVYGWWHETVVNHYQGGQGSYYTLGFEAGSGITALLLKFPLAVNVSLFRPYLWEVKNVVMLITAIESFFVLIVTFKIIQKRGLQKVISYFFSNPIVSFCITYSLLFLFAVGLASNNFGALARYKIPGLALYMLAIYVTDLGLSSKKVIDKRVR